MLFGDGWAFLEDTGAASPAAFVIQLFINITNCHGLGLKDIFSAYAVEKAALIQQFPDAGFDTAEKGGATKTAASMGLTF